MRHKAVTELCEPASSNYNHITLYLWIQVIL